jgi:hypothetical protein
VIAVFTKYDQFKREMRMKLEDQRRDLEELSSEMEKVFQEGYLANLGGSSPFVRLESENFVDWLTCTMLTHSVGMHRPGQQCTDLIEKTAKALSSSVILMLFAMQKDNLELSIMQAVKW